MKILTNKFGTSYAVGKPKYTYGKVVSVNRKKVVSVEWDNPDGREEITDAHLSQLKRVYPILMVLSRLSNKVKSKGWSVKTVDANYLCSKLVVFCLSLIRT